MRLAVALCAAALLTMGWSAIGQAADVTVTGTGKKGVRTCKGGGTATIAGNKCQLTIKGCTTVKVMGNANMLTLQGAQTVEVMGNKNMVKAGLVKVIKAVGNKNTVTYKLGPKKKKPKISNPGTKNTIRPE
jgi:hypothetical protein